MIITHSHNDQELLIGFAAGDRKAVETICKLYNARLFYFAVKLIHDETEAEDIAQEALLQLWQKREQFRGQPLKNAESFLFTIVKNKSLNFKRNIGIRARKLVNLEQTIESNEQFLELNIIREDYFNRIFEEVQQLSPTQVQLLKMVFIEHLDTAQVAEKLNISQNNVRVQKARALEKLRAAILRKRLLSLFFYFLLNICNTSTRSCVYLEGNLMCGLFI